MYLPVAPRLLWFRQDHPDWSILTTELHADEEHGIYRFECKICDAEGLTLAMGHGRETYDGFAKGPYEKAETISIGRALGALGYGTMESLDFVDDGDSKTADSPQRGTTTRSTTKKTTTAVAQEAAEDPMDGLRDKAAAYIRQQWNKLHYDPAAAMNSIREAATELVIAKPDIKADSPNLYTAVWLESASMDDLREYTAWINLKVAMKGGA